MAPPPSRRPGYSRRAQYGLFATYVVAIVGIVMSLLLALTARFDPQGHAAVQGVLADITSPISTAGRSAVGRASSAIDGVAAYIDAGSQNQRLASELRATRSAMIEARAIKRENARLVRLARLVESQASVVATARLIASTGASARRYATLSAGRTSGVLPGQPVRTSEGLIGRVVASGQISARVLLITDGGNVVPVRRVTDGLPALATGRGDGRLEIRAVEAGSNPFRVGDVFATSGAGGLYPPNVPVAVVRLSKRDTAVSQPLADPSRLDFAVVTQPFVRATDLPSDTDAS